MRSTVVKIIDGVANPGTGAVNSNPYFANQCYALSVQAFFSDGAAAGTLKLQCSNDTSTSTSTLANNIASDFTPTHWSDIPSATASVSSGGTVIIPLTQNLYQWIRVVFTSSAGAGTFSVNMNVQGF